MPSKLRLVLTVFCTLNLIVSTRARAAADEPDRDLIKRETEKLKELKLTALPVYSETAGKGVVKLENGDTLSWNKEALVFHPTLQWASASSIRTNAVYVFVNVGPSVVKVGDFEVKKGEYVLFKDKKLQKKTLKELAER